MSLVNVHDPEKAFNGYTLFCESFAEARRQDEALRTIYLIDMEGEPVHQWYTERSLQSHCRLLPNGNLIHPTHDRSEVNRGACGVYELDPLSNVAWSYRCRVDHDFQVLESGNLLIHTITDNMFPVLGPELKRHPYIVEVTREKDLVWQWRGEQHLAELEALLPPESWEHVMDRATGEFAFDWAHNNTAQVIPPNETHEKEVAAGRPSRFRPGNIFFSYRSNDVIGVIERDTGHIVWAWGPGVIDGQHKPHMLPSGNVLIFDNGPLRGWSRVIELNPLTEEIQWEYGAAEEERFLSGYISSAQRLPNGNTLICSGGESRLFEVTRDKEVVWEFVNPYHHERSWKCVYRCKRYSPEYVQPLLQRISEE